MSISSTPSNAVPPLPQDDTPPPVPPLNYAAVNNTAAPQRPSPTSPPSIASNGSNTHLPVGVILAGNRFKRVLQNRRMKKAGSPPADFVDDCEDLGISDAPYSHHIPTAASAPAQSSHMQQYAQSQSKHSFPSTTRARSSEAPGRSSAETHHHQPLPPPQHPHSGQQHSSGGPKVSGRHRFTSNIQSNFQALTANIRKHGAQLSNSFPSSNHSNVNTAAEDNSRRAAPPLPPKSAAVRVYQQEAAALAHKSVNAAVIHPGASKNLPAIANHNIATANTVMPRKVTTIAAKVIGAVDSTKRSSFVGSIGGGNRNSTITLKDATFQVPLSVPETENRNSFQIPDSPGISAALEYMRGTSRSPDGDAEKKKEKRRSRFSVLPGSSLASAHAAGNSAPPLPSRKEDSRGPVGGVEGASGLIGGRRVTDLSHSPSRWNKRRSASLGDVFKGGFTPVLSSTSSSSGSGIATQRPENYNGGVGVFHGSPNFTLQHNSSLPMNNYSQATPLGPTTPVEPLKNKMLNLKKRPTHRLSPSADGLMYRTLTNTSPLNPGLSPNAQELAASYAYVNADVDDAKPSSFINRPQVTPSNSYTGTPKSSGSGSGGGSSSVAGHFTSGANGSSNSQYFSPLAQPRTHKASMDTNNNTGGAYGSGGESSGTESNKGSVGGLKPRMATAGWSGSASQTGHGGNTSGTVNRRAPPPPSFHLTGEGGNPFPTTNPSTPSSGITGSPETSFSRARSNSSHTSLNGGAYQQISSSSGSGMPTRKLGSNVALVQALGQQPPVGAAYTTQNVVGSAAGTIGAAAGAAGGLAIHFGKKGWDRVEKLWGHRNNTPSMGGGMGYTTGDESGWVSTAATDAGGRSGKKSGVLGTMVRPPIRKGGVVFGRKLEDCVRETRVGVYAYVYGSAGVPNATDPPPTLKGKGVWVTALVTRCIEHLTEWGLEEEGLFRISGRASHINRLKSEFDAGADYLLKEVYPGDLDPHAVASVLKTYLRDLSEPILTRNLSTSFDITMAGTGTLTNPGHSLGVTSFGGISSGTFGYASTASLIEHPTAETMIDLKILINRLPKENFDLLYEICKLLRAVDKNSKLTKMPLSNLLLVFCPSLSLSPGFLKIVVEKQDYLFGDGDMGKVAPTPNHEAQMEKETASSSSSDFYKPSSTGGLPSSVRLRPSRQHGEAYQNNRVTAYPIAIDGSCESLLGSSSCESLSLNSPSSRLPKPLIPTTISAPMMHELPSTSSSISSTPSQIRSNANPITPASASSSLRLRHQTSHLASSRKSSLSMLFSGGSRPSTPVISAPIPIRAPTPSEPPVLSVALPDGTFTFDSDSPTNMYHDSPALTDPASPPTTISSPPTSDSEYYRLTITQESVHLASLQLRELPNRASKEVLVPRPAVVATSPVAIPAHSPPPRIGIFNSPGRSVGDDWAKSVLMAAGGNRA